MKGIYRFHWDCGRGELHGIHVADDSEVAKIVGKEAYFGEVLGKHSEIFGDVEADELELVTDDPGAVAVFEKHGMATGYWPGDYMEFDDEGAD
jgi:hypothetical protein